MTTLSPRAEHAARAADLAALFALRDLQRDATLRQLIYAVIMDRLRAFRALEARLWEVRDEC